jgi:hypothetical protein
MHAGATHAVANRKMVLTVFVLAVIVLGIIVSAISRRHWRCHLEVDLAVFLSGGTWDPQALHRS